MLGYDAIGYLAIGQFTVKNTYHLPSVVVTGGASVTGMPTSHYKQILAEPRRRIIYAAEISPWSVT